jgi:hypothetical protein
LPSGFAFGIYPLMKITFASLIIWMTLPTLPAFALDFKVVGPCSETPQFQTSISAAADSNLGDLTIATLKSHAIPFDGSREGIKSIQQSPTGDDAFEILSDTQMRAYGWCVAIDGVQPDQMPGSVRIPAGAKEILWFYAFSFYDAGTWKDYCTPSWKVKSLDVCK